MRGELFFGKIFSLLRRGTRRKGSNLGQKDSAPKQLLVIAGQRINVVSGLLFLPPTLVRARRLSRNLSLNIAGDRRRDSP